MNIKGTVITVGEEDGAPFDNSRLIPKEVRIYSIAGQILAGVGAKIDSSSQLPNGAFAQYNWEANLFVQDEQEVIIYVTITDSRGTGDETYFYKYTGDSVIHISAAAQFDINISNADAIFIPIFNEKELAMICTNTSYPASGHYRLMNNLQLTKEPWIPIGNDNNPDSPPFTGVFDGQNYLISGLKLDGTNFTNVGLFGVIAPASGSSSPAAISNLTVELNDENNIPTTARSRYIGAVAGNIRGGNIDKVSVISTSSKGMSIAQSIITGTDIFIGGIAGLATNSTITKSSSQVSVTANAKTSARLHTGGILGSLSAGVGITDCYSTGSITAINPDGALSVGGIVGSNYGNAAGGGISFCYASGAILGSPKMTEVSCAGGIAGCGEAHSGSVTSKISSCAYLNPRIEASVGTNLSYKRIIGHGAGTLAKNFSADDTISAAAGSLTDADGKRTPASETMTLSFFENTTTGLGWVFHSDSNPLAAWKWDSTKKKPVIY